MVYRKINPDLKECALRLWKAVWSHHEICDVLWISKASLYCWQANYDEYEVDQDR
jgi:hypothetical protein